MPRPQCQTRVSDLSRAHFRKRDTFPRIGMEYGQTDRCVRRVLERLGEACEFETEVEFLQTKRSWAEAEAGFEAQWEADSAAHWARAKELDPQHLDVEGHGLRPSRPASNDSSTIPATAPACCDMACTARSRIARSDSTVTRRLRPRREYYGVHPLRAASSSWGLTTVSKTLQSGPDCAMMLMESAEDFWTSAHG
jgi:hypothetical protein